MKTENYLKVGAAEENITPQVPMRLVGMGREFIAEDGEKFSYTGRDVPTGKIHDPLMLQATFLCKGSKKVVILVADLLYTIALDEVRAAVSEACNIPIDAVFYASTHNHNGPCRTDEYSDFLCGKAVKSALKAMSKARPVIAEHARGNYDRLSYNRPEPWEPVDGSVDVVRFVEPDTGKLVTMWWNYGCHPCSLSWDFNEISADYPGVLRKCVTETLEEPVPISFFLSGAGNVQITGMKRFVEPPQMFFGVPKGNFEIVERLGSCVVDAGLRALNEKAQRVTLNDLNWENYCIEMPVHTDLSNDELNERKKSLSNFVSENIIGPDSDTPFEVEISKLVSEWIDELVEQKSKSEKTRKIAGGLITLGNLALVFSPFELAWQITARIRERSPFPITLFSTTSLGFESYLTESKFYEFEPERRPYEVFGLQILTGYSYTSKGPKIFENATIEELQKISGKE